MAGKAAGGKIPERGKSPAELQPLNDELRTKADFLEDLLNNAGAPVVVWNPDLKITLFNRAAEKLTGRSAAAVLGKRPDVLFPPEKKDSLLMEINRNTAQGRGWDGVEIPVLHTDGSVRVALWNSAVIFGGDGKTPVATIAQGQDITERKKIEQLKDDFIGMVSHELRTPLTVVSSAITAAMDEGISPQDLKILLEAADSGAESLGRLLDNFLELARYKADRLTLEKKLANVEEVIRNTLEKVHHQYPMRHAALDIPERLPPVLIDPARLERIIYNLVENAFKYSPKDSEVQVFARQDKEGLLIGVRDHGAGMSPEETSKLFEPFERIGATNKKGVGLGLVVCKRLVEAHGGRIWVESTPGQGSTFLFVIPQGTSRSG